MAKIAKYKQWPHFYLLLLCNRVFAIHNTFSLISLVTMKHWEIISFAIDTVMWCDKSQKQLHKWMFISAKWLYPLHCPFNVVCQSWNQCDNFCVIEARVLSDRGGGEYPTLYTAAKHTTLSYDTIRSWHLRWWILSII